MTVVEDWALISRVGVKNVKEAEILKCSFSSYLPIVGVSGGEDLSVRRCCFTRVLHGSLSPPPTGER